MRQNRFFRRGALLCATVLVTSIPLHAQSVRKGIDVSAEGEVTTNPYLDDGSSDWVGAGSVEIRPWLVSQTETDRIELEAFARGRAFTSEYDFEDSFGGSLSASSRASTRTALFGQASLMSTSARSNFARFNRPGFGTVFGFEPLTPTGPEVPFTNGDVGTVLAPPPGAGIGPIILPPLDDITIVGLTGRSTSLGLTAGMSRQLDARSSLNATVGYNRLWVSEDATSGYENAVVSLGYSRALSERTTAGIALSAGRSRYDEGVIPGATTLTAAVNAQHRFDENWSLNGSVGVSNTRSEARGIYPEVNDTGLVGSIAGCRTDAQSRLCLGFSRSQQPSTLGEVRTSDAINLSLSERLSARDRVELYANYGRSLGINDFAMTPEDIEIVAVGGTYSRTFSNRFEGFAFARASRSYGGFLSDEPSVSFGLGISARFGDQR
ncbi:autotransporter outer membrane beta-barrel domain-containing protein [Qipengyuania sediminis]|uniref:autotransporter outer membrane beta-barrel domain-containing protein n=1 Tax=Qipengyuania sediminis TaxID=1532023 RepID=UPI00140485D3|nr:autotransporter outer membrane beta-barrel domain-containing protein [Qipengyuania sediminis]